MRGDVKPFFVPSVDHIKASPWLQLVDDGWEELGPYVENWDYRTRLHLRCEIEAAIADIRAEARLTDRSPLGWAIGWRTTDTRLVGPPLVIPAEEDTMAVPIELEVPADRAGAGIVLTRRLVLQRDRMYAHPGEARLAGSILWSDETTVRLTGQGAAFPTEVVDFRDLGRDAGASWYLDLPAVPDVPAMGSMILLINSADTALVAAVSRSRRHTDVQETLIATMEEGVVEEFVRWALSRWEQLEDVDPDSVGAAARTLARRVLPDPESWASSDIDSMSLRAAITDGARRIGFGRKLA
jgi:hypothetical protein